MDRRHREALDPQPRQLFLDADAAARRSTRRPQHHLAAVRAAPAPAGGRPEQRPHRLPRHDRRRHRHRPGDHLWRPPVPAGRGPRGRVRHPGSRPGGGRRDPARAAVPVQQPQLLVSAVAGHGLRHGEADVHGPVRIRCGGERHAAGTGDADAHGPRHAPAQEVRLRGGAADALFRVDRQPLPDGAGAAAEAAGRSRAARDARRGQSAAVQQGARARRQGRRHPQVLQLADGRRALRELPARDHGERPAGRAQPRVFRDAEPAPPAVAVRLVQRPGVVPDLSVVLHRARDRAPVVGPGRGLEELPRAMAERGVRAVLRRPVCGTRARPRTARVGAPPDAPLGDRDLAAGTGVSRLSPRPHQGGRAHLPRAGLQQGRDGAAHAPPPDG